MKYKEGMWDVQYSLSEFVRFAKEYTLTNKNAFEERLEKADKDQKKIDPSHEASQDKNSSKKL